MSSATALAPQPQATPGPLPTEVLIPQAPERERLLDQVLAESRSASDPEPAYTRDLVGELIDQAMAGTLTFRRDLVTTLDLRIAELDRLMSAQINEVLHHPDFQALEGSWRGLHHLVRQSETGPMLRLKVMSASKAELVRDFRTAADFDQSGLFRKVYEEEYGTFGGAPFACLIGDYAFSRSPGDLYLLEELSHIAAAAHAPFIAAASPHLFGMERFTEIGRVRQLSKVFETVEYTRWKAFRESEDARYVGLVLPRVLARLPYGADTVPVDAFSFEEEVDGQAHERYLWCNAAYAYGCRLTAAFARHGWLAAIRGVEGGGLVEGLPAHTFKTEEGDLALKCPTEVALTDRTEKQLSDLGFIALVHCKHTDTAAFFSGSSVQKARAYLTDLANANVRLSTQLPYLFAVSRIAHYLKAIMRDKIGAFASRENVESHLNTWLSQYVLLDDSASQEAKARAPLREARVEVATVPGRPGCYRAAAFLQPHFQLDELTVSLRLVTDLPAGTR